MRRHAKAPSTGSRMRGGSRLGRIVRGALATRAPSHEANESGAPATGRAARLGFAAALALAALAALFASPSLAGTITSHELVSTFDGSATPAGSFGVFENGFNLLAVDSARGRVYVIDREHEVVDVFGETGNYITQIDGSTTTDGAFGFVAESASSQTANVAVDQSGGPTQGRVYVATGAALYAYSAKYAFLWELHYSVTQRATGLAVDGEGTVWASGPGGQLTKYTPEGDLGFGQENAVSGGGIALDSSADLYSLSYGEVNKYDPGLTLVDSYPFNLARNIAFDKTAGGLYVLDPDHGVTLLDPAGMPVDHFGSVPLEEDKARGIGVDELTNTVYVVDRINERIDVFAPVSAVAPEATIEPVSAITETEAHLSGSVNPEGHPTSWRFEYRKKGAANWIATSSEDAGSGGSGVPISADISELAYGTVYQVRVVAESTDSGKVASAQTTFLTTPQAPTARTLPVGPRTTTTARLNASLDPQGAQTTYYFEYGTDAGYGQSVPVGQDADGGITRGVHLVSQVVAGLEPGTTYHYRIAAENEKGPSTGEDATFTTRTAQEMEMPARGIELVNSPFKGNQSATPPTGSFQKPPFVSPDGSRALWSVFAGTPDSTTGSTPLFLATRSADGWRSQGLIPPASEQYGEGSEHFSLQRVSSDFSRFLLNNSGTFTNFPYAFMRVDDKGNADTVATFPTPLNLEVAGSSVQSSADLSHLVYLDWSNNEVYDNHDGATEMVSLLQDGEPPACGAMRESFVPKPYDLISEDASRIYFISRGDECGKPPQLFLRDRNTETTTLVSGPPVSGTAKTAEFIRATPDGREAIFQTTAKLVVEDANTASDIYRFAEGSGLSCLTCGVAKANVSRVFVASKDLSYVYFTSAAQFDPPNGSPGVSADYVWHDGQVHYITDAKSSLGMTATWTRLAAGGSVLLFAEEKKGTTTDGISPCPPPPPGQQSQPCFQLYRYDATSGSLDCVSCRPDGPTEGSVGIGGFALSADGATVAFTTLAPLVSEDVNRAYDVYEWHNDAVRPITDGVTKFPAKGEALPKVWGTSADGHDIFFSVAAPLTGFEKDGLANLYDARIGGGFRPETPPAPCVEDSCQGPLLPSPAVSHPGSASFSGAGNEPSSARQRHRHRKHRRHRRRGAQGKAHRHGKSRRSGRGA